MSTVNLWDQNFAPVAGQMDCPKPQYTGDGRYQITLSGDGPVSSFVRDNMPGFTDENFYVSVDLDATEYEAGSRRISGIVHTLKVGQHTCECGSNVIKTTTIDLQRHPT